MVYIVGEYCFHDSHIVCTLKLFPSLSLFFFFQATLRVAAALQCDTWITISKIGFQSSLASRFLLPAA